MTDRAEHQRDLVFNAETCRALRWQARDFGQVAAATITFFVCLIVIDAVSKASLSPTVKTAGLVVTSCMAALMVVLVMRWANLWPSRETIRELRGVIDSLRSGNLFEKSGDVDASPAMPALALGRSGLDWVLVIGAPLTVAFNVVLEHNGDPLLLWGCVVFGIILFLITPFNNTYPVADSPEGTNRGDE